METLNKECFFLCYFLCTGKEKFGVVTGGNEQTFKIKKHYLCLNADRKREGEDRRGKKR